MNFCPRCGSWLGAKTLYVDDCDCAPLNVCDECERVEDELNRRAWRFGLEVSGPEDTSDHWVLMMPVDATGGVTQVETVYEGRRGLVESAIYQLEVGDHWRVRKRNAPPGGDEDEMADE